MLIALLFKKDRYELLKSGVKIIFLPLSALVTVNTFVGGWHNFLSLVIARNIGLRSSLGMGHSNVTA